MENILITGNLGYIGCILTEKLIKENYKITGIDTKFYSEDFFYDFKFSGEVQQIQKDIRNIDFDDLEGIDAIIHLAALSNDPLGKLNPKLTHKINYESSLRLAKLAKKKGIKRFVFSSSCSIYGDTGKAMLDEDSAMNPLTPYAKSKVDLENALKNLENKNFSPTFMRNGTAYGISPSMRFDLVVNNLMGWAYTTSEIKILSDGKAWRPIVHVKDIANAFLAVLKASKEKIHNQAFNVGINSENYQIKDIAKKIHQQMEKCKIRILGEDNPDQRTYIVNFDKIQETLDHFNPEFNLEKGIKEIKETFENVNLNEELFKDKRFTRLEQLKYLINEDLIDHELFWN
jgi:nucleoside-diphosphate-sugar epimerase